MQNKRYMVPVTPSSAEDLACTLREAASQKQTISVAGNNSKRLMAGPLVDTHVSISTSGLNRILQYEPSDLTVSVESGVLWSDLQRELSKHGQTIALDPPFYRSATVGGVIASQSTGPLRARFGTARDLIIGMQFAMLNGKLIRTGGMVVKNVAGLDMGKLMIGSFGTLAAITSVNFRLHTLPVATNTFLYQYGDLTAAIQQRDQLLASVLRPIAVDLLTPPAAARLERRGYVLAIRAAGSQAVLNRYAAELSLAERLDGEQDKQLWRKIREFPCDFLLRQPEGVILRVSTPLGDLTELLKMISGFCVSRAASGVTYLYFNHSQQIQSVWERLAQKSWPTVVEFGPHEVRQKRELWLRPKARADAGFDMMKSIKQMFDPENLLNRSRLYGRI
jgi:glycolate oxidase FAD binding subunit